MSGPYVTPDEWRAWLLAHDLKPDRTLAVEIVPESLRDNNAGAVLLRVEQLATDSEGRYPMFDPRPMHDDIAREVVWIPLRRILGDERGQA